MAIGQRSRRVARNVAVSASADLVGKVVSLAFVAGGLRLLGADGFGYFAAALALSQVLGALVTGGFDELLAQRGTADRGRTPGLAAVVVAWRLLLSALVLGPLLLLGRFTGAPTSVLVLVYGATMLHLVEKVWRDVAMIHEDLGGVSRARVIDRVASAGLGLVGAATVGVVGFAAGYLAGAVLGLGGTVVAVRRLGVRLDPAAVGMASMRETGRASFPLAAEGIVSEALAHADQVLVAALAGPAAVGLYAAAYRIMETGLFLTWAASRALVPVMLEARGARAVVAIERGTAMLAVLYIPFAGGVAITANDVVALLVEPELVAQAAATLRWLALVPMLLAVSHLGRSAMLARERYAQRLGVTTAATVVNLAVTVALVPALGPVGAAIASVIGYAVLVTLLVVLLRRDVGFPDLRRALAAPTIATTAMMAVLTALALPFGVDVVTGVVLYGVVWLVVARWLAPEHLQMFSTVLSRRGWGRHGRVPRRPAHAAAGADVTPPEDRATRTTIP